MTHWVEDERFQLLENPASLKDLQQIVTLNLETLSKGIQPETLAQFITLTSDSSATKIYLTCDSINDRLTITASLKPIQDDEVKLISSVHNNDNPLTFVEWREPKAIVHAAVPTRGRYSLAIYAGVQGTDHDHVKSTRCLSYVLTAECDTKDSEFIGFPEVYETSAAECNFSILIKEASNSHVCKATDKLVMKLKVERNTKLSHYICQGKVTDPTIHRHKCYTHISTDKDDPELHHFTVLFPKQGWWTIFMLNKKTEHNYVLMRYQIFATSECKSTIYPHITDTAKELGISLEDENMEICYSDSSLFPFTVRFTALYGLQYKAKLMEMNEHGNAELQVSTSVPQCRTYVSVPLEGKCTAYIYAIVPPGTWSLDLFANETQFMTLKHVISAEPLHGSEFMKFKVFPLITSDFSDFSLSPPPNVEEWVLPEIVSDYPKNINIPFIQTSNEVQLFCSVEHDRQEMQQQDIAKLETYAESEYVIRRILAIVVCEKGEWTFTLKGRHLQEYKSVSTLLEYTVKGL